MPIVVVGLLVLVIFVMAGQGAPVSNGGMAAQVPPPDATVAPSGVTATISPAMSGGSPQLASDNTLRLDTNMRTVAPAPGVFGGNLMAARVAGFIAASMPNAVGPTNQQSELATAVPRTRVIQVNSPGRALFTKV